MQFGTVPYIKKTLLVEVKNQAFCFKFDESTTEQVKKQYDANFTYYLLSQKEILVSYFSSLFLDYCTAEDIIKHFHEFMSRCDLNVRILLDIVWMDQA